MPTITPFLWFDTQAEEAMTFYASVFKRSKVISVNRAQGKVMAVQFEQLMENHPTEPEEQRYRRHAEVVVAMF